MKWKSNKLVLKVTNDEECLKYKSHSISIFNRFEQFNKLIMSKLSNQTLPIEQPQQQQQQQQSQQHTTNQSKPSQQQQGDSSTSKKKKNKKNK